MREAVSRSTPLQAPRNKPPEIDDADPQRQRGSADQFRQPWCILARFKRVDHAGHPGDVERQQIQPGQRDAQQLQLQPDVLLQNDVRMRADIGHDAGDEDQTRHDTQQEPEDAPWDEPVEQPERQAASDAKQPEIEAADRREQEDQTDEMQDLTQRPGPRMVGQEDLDGWPSKPVTQHRFHTYLPPFTGVGSMSM